MEPRSRETTPTKEDLDFIVDDGIVDDGKKYYIHPFFTKYAASKEGEILNVKTGRIFKKI